MEYIVGTISGYLKRIQLRIDEKNELTIKGEALKTSNEQTKYAVYGLATSMNNALLLIGHFARRVSFH